MSDTRPLTCICDADRPSNEALATLMARVARRDKGALETLSVLVKPLVYAFHEGQVQAGRVPAEELEALVTATLWRVYQQRLGYDRQQPFRAWLLQLARDTVWERQGTHEPSRQALARPEHACP